MKTSKIINVGDTVVIRGDTQLIYQNGKHISRYYDHQLVDGKWLKHTGTGLPWTGVVVAIKDDMVFLQGGGICWNIYHVESVID